MIVDSKANWSIGENKQYEAGIKGLFYNFVMTNLDITYEEPITSEIEILRINFEDGLSTINAQINNRPVAMPPICETVVMNGNTLEESIVWNRLSNCLENVQDPDGLYGVGLEINTVSSSSGDTIFTILCRDNSDNLPLTLEEWLDEEILVKKSCEYDFPLTKFELKQYRWEIVTIDAIFCDIECYLNDNVSKVSNYEVGKREFISVSDSYVFDSEFNSGRIYLALLLSLTIIVVVLISVYRNSRESVGLGIGTKYPTILKIKMESKTTSLLGDIYYKESPGKYLHLAKLIIMKLTTAYQKHQI